MIKLIGKVFIVIICLFWAVLSLVRIVVFFGGWQTTTHQQTPQSSEAQTTLIWISDGSDQYGVDQYCRSTYGMVGAVEKVYRRDAWNQLVFACGDKTTKKAEWFCTGVRRTVPTFPAEVTLLIDFPQHNQGKLVKEESTTCYPSQEDRTRSE